MEEAEALSSKMGIMVQGGLFTCFGGSQHIKDKFGSGYEIELKMFKFNKDELKHLIPAFGMRDTDTETLHSANELIQTAVDKKIIAQAIQEDLTNSILKILYNINSHNMNILSVKLTINQFLNLLHCYISINHIIHVFLKEFESLDILESHGDEYFKLRVPRKNKTIGFIFGKLESFN